MLAHAKSSTTSVLNTAADLANGRASSCDLIEAALAQIADPTGEGARTFVKVYGDSARAAANAQDRLRRAGYIAPGLGWYRPRGVVPNRFFSPYPDCGSRAM